MQSIVRFRHCGRSIYTFSPREENQAGGAGGRCQREENQAGGAGGRCQREENQAGGAGGRCQREENQAGGAGGRCQREGNQEGGAGGRCQREEIQAGGAGGKCQREEQNQAGGAGGRCPLCGDLLSFQLLDAPVVLLSPFSNGHETPWALLISSRSGPPSISEQNESELHVGISNSAGVVFSYTESGVQRQQHGWEQSLTIPLVTPSNHPSPPLLPASVLRSWDRHLETFSSQDRWTTDRFAEEGEFGSCCYGFALSFINEVRRSEVMEVVSQHSFTLRYVLPTMHCSSKYLSLYNHIVHHGHYCSTTG